MFENFVYIYIYILSCISFINKYMSKLAANPPGNFFHKLLDISNPILETRIFFLCLSCSGDPPWILKRALLEWQVLDNSLFTNWYCSSKLSDCSANIYTYFFFFNNSAWNMLCIGCLVIQKRAKDHTVQKILEYLNSFLITKLIQTMLPESRRYLW